MKKYTKIICMAAAVCLLGAAAFCGFRIYSHYAHESEQEEVFEKIAEVVEQAQTGESETVDVLLMEEETVLAEYGELYLQNEYYGQLRHLNYYTGTAAAEKSSKGFLLRIVVCCLFPPACPRFL